MVADAQLYFLPAGGHQRGEIIYRTGAKSDFRIGAAKKSNKDKRSVLTFRDARHRPLHNGIYAEGGFRDIRRQDASHV